MNGAEIFSLVSKKKQQIEDLLDPTMFVLNKEIAILQEEINELQNQCPHEYKTGVCIYCGMEEKQ